VRHDSYADTSREACLKYSVSSTSGLLLVQAGHHLAMVIEQMPV
jgi:hypothetical protein